MTDMLPYDPNRLPIRASITAGKLVDADIWQTYANIAATVAPTEFVPKDLRGKPESVLACLLYGHDLGLGPMVALREITMIEGKPSLSASLVTARVREAGHTVRWENAYDGAGNVVGVTAHGKRADNGDEGSYTFTLGMAKRAGLAGKTNWQRYPESMMWARAATQLARMLFSDVFLGHATYTPEELGAEDSAGSPSHRNQTAEEGPRSPTPPAGSADQGSESAEGASSPSTSQGRAVPGASREAGNTEPQASTALEASASQPDSHPAASTPAPTAPEDGSDSSGATTSGGVASGPPSALAQSEGGTPSDAPAESPFQPPPSVPLDPRNSPLVLFTDQRSTQARTLKKLDVTVAKAREEGLIDVLAVHATAHTLAPDLIGPAGDYADDAGTVRYSLLRKAIPLWLASQMLDQLAAQADFARLAS